MKLRLLLLSSIISLSCAPCFGADHYQQGKFYFNRADYKGANLEFKQAVQDSPYNVNYRYYYAQTLIQLNRLHEAQSEYQKIIETDPNSEAARFSVIGISKIRNYLDNRDFDYKAASSDTENSLADALSSLDKKLVNESYIQNVANERGLIVRWSTSKMPVTVNITGGSQTYATLAKEAFSAWGKASGGVIKISYTGNPANADIRITFKNNLDTAKKNEGSKESGFIAGLTNSNTKDNFLNYASMTISIRDPAGNVLSENQTYNTIIHESGHALGIWGHSNEKEDIMCSVNYEYKNTDKKRKLTQRDINTIKLLYKLNPDISNDPATQLANNKTPNKNESIIGDKNERLQNKLKEANEYVKRVPDKPISWTALANAHKELKDYPKAEVNYKKALSFDPTYRDALIGLADLYRQKNNYVNTVLTYKKLVLLEPRNSTYSCLLAGYYLMSNKPQDAKAVMDMLFLKNPAAVNDDNIKYIMSKLGSTK